MSETIQQNRYLGEEKVTKLLWKFSIPCVTGLLIGAFYNIIDQMFIGNSELGFLGNAATGISFPLICIANAFAWCIGDGSAAFLSICAGQKDTGKAHKCVGSGLTGTLIISVIFAVFCLIFRVPLMKLFGASERTLTLSVTYFTILAAFFPIYQLMNVMNAMIRADGAPSYSMKALLAGAGLNILLDPLFIFVFRWGIAGAAWATVIGQTVSFLVDVFYFFHPQNFRLSLKSFLPDPVVFRRTVSMGSSTFITQISIVAVTLVCNIMLSKYGSLSVYGPDIPLSAFSIQTKVYTIINNIVVGIVLGGQPIFGYNYGAGKMDRVRKAYLAVLKATVIIGLSATLVFEFCPQLVVRMFGAGNQAYLEFACHTFRIYLSTVTVTCILKISGIFFQSIGKVFQSVAASLVRDLICFVPLAVILPMLLETGKAGTGIFGILIAAPIADSIALILVAALTISFFRRLPRSAYLKSKI